MFKIFVSLLSGNARTYNETKDRDELKETSLVTKVILGPSYDKIEKPQKLSVSHLSGVVT